MTWGECEGAAGYPVGCQMPPDAARNATVTQAGATFAGHYAISPTWMISLTSFRSRHRYRRRVGPLFSICVRTRRLWIMLIFGVRCPRPACVGRGLTDQGAVS